MPFMCLPVNGRLKCVEVALPADGDMGRGWWGLAKRALCREGIVAQCFSCASLLGYDTT